jgi:hypothetical protein
VPETQKGVGAGDRGPVLGRNAIVSWYVHRAEAYARWVPAETYAGPGFAAGAWVILKEEVIGDFEIARYQSALARDRQRFPSLEAWLAAEARGEVEPAGVTEPEVRDFMSRKALSRYIDVRTRVLKFRPRS